MLAKRLGARKVMALINKPSYADLMESGNIDIAISPQTITIGSLLAHVRRGDVVRVHSACGAARPRRSKPWCTARTRLRAWSAARSATSRCPKARPSARWCAATR